MKIPANPMGATPATRTSSIRKWSLVAAAAMAATCPGQAAPITWGSATNITGLATDVSTTGTLVAGSALTGTTDTGRDVTINTVPFAAGLIWPTATSLSSSGRVALTAGAATMDSDYLVLLQSESYQNAENTVTLSGLISGHPYQVQVWVSDSAQAAGKTSTVLDGTKALYWEASATEGAWGQYVIGTFTADAATQTFKARAYDFFGGVNYVGTSGTQATRNTFLSGIQVRDLTPNSDFTAPAWAATWPQVNPLDSTSLSVSAQTNEAGIAYFVVLADGASAPTAAQVKAGHDSADLAALKSGSIALTAATETTASVTGLLPGTHYDVWFVAQDAVPNLQAAPAKVSVATLADTTPPTLTSADIFDNAYGGPILTVDTVIYTVVFSKPMNPATVGIDDFRNAGSPAATINSVTATADPAVFTVSVTPGAGVAGTLQLQVVNPTELRDVAGNALVTNPVIADDTIIVVNFDHTAPTLISIGDDTLGEPVELPATVTYTVVFSEPLKASTVGTDDFENIGTAAATITNVSATGNSEVVTVSVTASGPGSLRLQIKQNADLQDLGNNPLDTRSALPDDTTITVNPDVTPPTPGTMSFATLPTAVATTAITMTATTATDPSGVEYYFTCTAGAGHDSGWQDSPIYFDIGLTANTAYTYTVKARDKASPSNGIIASTAAFATTPSTDIPEGVVWGAANNITGLASDVSTAGTLVTGSALTGTIDATKNVTVNGVSFAAGLIWNGASNAADTDDRVSPTFATTIMDSNYRILLKSESYQNALNTVTLSGLISGQTYAVQVWVSDNAQAYARTSTVLDGTRAVYWEAGPDTAWGQYVIGTFTASGASQTFSARSYDFYGGVDYLGNSGIQATRNTFLGGIQVRKLSAGNSGYDEWVSPFGLSAGSQGGDSDNDGLSNFDEYAFGLNPTSGASVNPIAVPLDKSAGTFSYTRRAQALTGLTYTVRSSTSLAAGSWATLVKNTDYTELVTGLVGDVETVKVTLSPALLTAPKLFLQVRAAE